MKGAWLSLWQDRVTHPVRQIPLPEKAIYLTFDDGPDPDYLDSVLQVLDRYDCRATFFMVARKAEKNRHFVDKVLTRGHAVGDHSLDHTYGHFFSTRENLKQWILRSQALLQDVCGSEPVGFRPPNGVCTPALGQVLRELKIPLYLWRQRFFDTRFSWTEMKARKSLDETESGDIVLLHDSLPKSLANQHIKTLDFYLAEARRRGFNFNALNQLKRE